MASLSGTSTGEYQVSRLQIAGLAADARSDIWAMGVLLCEMLTGQLPFEGANLQDLCRCIRRKDFPRQPLRNAGVSSSFDALIVRCLQKVPAARYASPGELQKALQQICARVGKRADEPRRQRIGEFWHTCRSKPRLPAVLCSLLLGLSLFFFARPNDQDAEQQAGMRLLNTDAMDGQAEVFRYGQHVGKTPLQLREHQGDHISLLLKRPGHADLPVDFDVTDRTSYTYVLKPLLGTVP